MDDDDILTPMKAVFLGNSSNQRALDYLFRDLMWYYTNWEQDYAYVQDIIDYYSDYTATQKTVTENAPVLLINNDNEPNSDA